MSKTSIPIAAGASASKWSSLEPPLSKGSIKCLKKVFGFKQMTPVQAAVIPLFMSNKDVAVEVCQEFYILIYVFLKIQTKINNNISNQKQCPE